MLGLIVKTAAIQPKWAIDENAIIFRICVWFRPPHPPVIVDRTAIVRSTEVFREFCVKYNSDRGASFCQVAMIRAVFKVEPWSTSGSQKCSGASPSFIDRAIVSIMLAS